MSDRYCILIADASPTFRSVLRAELDPTRFDVIEAGDGESAIELARKHRPAVMTVSFVLPGCDGIEVCKAITSSEMESATTVVMITSNDSDEDRNRAFEAGAVRFLSKGFPKGELASYVDTIIGSMNRLKGARLLVADDNPFIRTSITQLLQSEGAEVLQAADGLEGLELLKQNEIDVVLTDFHMPNMDGIAFVESLRKERDYETMPVLFLSGSGDRRSRIRALDAGANDFIVKPFEGMELLARMRSFVRLAELTRRLKVEARTDVLTGVLARRETMIRLEERCAESKRYHTPFSCIMLDIDHFKSFNDTHGHAAGDAVLKIVAKTIQSSLRQSDLVGRIGGEEFMILCTNTPLDAGVQCAEKVRRAVENAVAVIDDKQLSATISLGVAEFGDLVADADFIMNAADRALYEAKRQGRNRVCAFRPETNSEDVLLEVALSR